MSRQRRINEIERDREALSLRGINRLYGYSREYLGALIRAGELTATPHGRALKIFRSDFEAWMRSRALRSTSHAEERAARLLAKDAAREQRAGAAGGV